MKNIVDNVDVVLAKALRERKAERLELSEARRIAKHKADLARYYQTRKAKNKA